MAIIKGKKRNPNAPADAPLAKISLYMSVADRERFRAVAAAENRSLSNLADKIMMDYVIQAEKAQ